MIGADNVLAQGDGGAIKHGQLPLRQENVGNVGATSEQGGMGKCRKCRSKVGARWIGKTSEQSWSKVGKKMVYDSFHRYRLYKYKLFRDWVYIVN